MTKTRIMENSDLQNNESGTKPVDSKIESQWKRFKTYFWILFVLHLIPKGFSGIETTTDEQAMGLFIMRPFKKVCLTLY